MKKNEVFFLEIDKISPSQLYLSEKKLKELADFKPTAKEALPIKQLDGKIFLTDAHHRAYLFYKTGFTKLPVYWDVDELPLEIYEICLDWCHEAELMKISDFEGRILTEADYKKLWHDRCEKHFG